jgi:hypothetical protein
MKVHCLVFSSFPEKPNPEVPFDMDAVPAASDGAGLAVALSHPTPGTGDPTEEVEDLCEYLRLEVEDEDQGQAGREMEVVRLGEEPRGEDILWRSDMWNVHAV